MIVTDYLVRRTMAEDAALLGGDGEAWRRGDAILWGPRPFETRFRALWAARGLYLRFDASDAAPWHTMTRRDDPIWEEEVVEIFLDPDRTGVRYAELEINPINVVCDLVVLQPWPDLRGDATWHFEDLDTCVQRRRDERIDGPDSWTALARIGWADFGRLPARAALPPDAGDRWRFNVYRIKRPEGPARANENVIYAAWSPTGGPSFHVPAAFRDFVFSD